MEPVDGAVDSDGWIALDDLTRYVCENDLYPEDPWVQTGYCDNPAGPLPLAEGQVACGYGWPLGTRFVIAGLEGEHICNDRGGGLLPRQLDYFCWKWSTCKTLGAEWPWRATVRLP